ncbi:hypothetical protein [Loktanella sp. SALINAS62]|uniref:DUF7742 family protein n=1 Tax=Loktanella sp. SALINAS62 TaxID=2706124 RepID=UPI001B8B03D5|nr:hypothetical protein [Loktanella sp. SALINAS62]MBS1303582.1 hypothetical protein [Loktanella sp. SALINAS62]
MRPIGLLDLDAVVRRVQYLTPADAAARARHIIQSADTADRYRKRTDRRHTLFGDGTLAAAAGAFPAVPVAQRIDDSYLAALTVVVHALREKRRF